jgi:replicative DNA helicase
MEKTREYPNAPRIEASLLSAIITSPDSIYNCIQLLNSDCFYTQKYRIIWDAIIHMHTNGDMIDVPKLYIHLKDNNKIDLVGGHTAIVQLTNEFFTTNINGYAKILYILSPDVTRVNTAHNIINNNLQHIKENLGKYQEVTGVPSGYEHFDLRTGGAGAGWLMIIGGRPSMGKTTFVINMAWNAYKLFNKSGIFFSGEMSSKQISHLIMATESGIPASDIKKNRVSKVQLECMFDTFRKQHNGVFLIDDTPNPALTHILAEATKAKMQHDIDFVIIDYIQLIKASGASRHLEVGRISRELKALARNLNIPVIALAQLSRAVENRPSKRPQLSDLKESGDIEQDADVVSFLYRPEYYGIEKDENGKSLEGITELLTKKNRHGEIGSDLLYMNKKTSSFEMYDEQGEQSIPVERYNRKLIEMQDINVPQFDLDGDIIPF